MSGSRQTTTQYSNQERNPWEAAVPALQDAANAFAGWQRGGGEVYSGPRVAEVNDYLNQGMSRLADNAGFDQASEYHRGVLSGRYLDPNSNPHLQNLQNMVRSSVMPSVNSVFSRSGMTGSTAHQGTLTRALTDGLAAPMFQNYENERARQGQSAQALPALYGQNAQALINAGMMQRGFDQEGINADRAAWEEARMAPVRRYMEAMPYLGQLGSMGGTSEGNSRTTTREQMSPLQVGLGLGSMAMGAFGGPMGMFGSGLMGSMAGGMSPSTPWTTTVNPYG